MMREALQSVGPELYGRGGGLDGGAALQTPDRRERAGRKRRELHLARRSAIPTRTLNSPEPSQPSTFQVSFHMPSTGLRLEPSNFTVLKTESVR